MKKRYRLLIAIGFCLPAFAGADELKVVLDTPVEISKPGPQGLVEPKQIAAGEEFKLETDKAYWIQAKGKIPILVLPQVSSGSKEPVKVQMPNVLDWPSLTTQHQIDTKLSQLMDELSAFQDAIRRRDIQSAQQALDRMENVARLEYLAFMKATLKFLQGDLQGAKSDAERAMRRFPANVEGQRFLKTLEGNVR